MSARADAEVDRVWHALVSLVMDSRGDWKRKVADATGLPFSRVRALRRLVDGPLTLRDLAESMASDAPAATLAVNDLEERGLVRREPHPDDRRAKLVTLTMEGRRVVGLARKVTDRAPDSLAALSAKDVAALWRILEPLDGKKR
jgi:DNA-binding MarR family transcriptional regulator